jgi:hypothetical protein
LNGSNRSREEYSATCFLEFDAVYVYGVLKTDGAVIDVVEQFNPRSVLRVNLLPKGSRRIGKETRQW